jgi:ribosomal protein S18 acetylase RimI-like enzyme
MNPTIRRATSADLPALGRLGAHLVRTHHQFDPQRFMSPGGNVEVGYASFLGAQVREDNAVVLVAEHEGEIVGYVYAGLEPQSWKELRDPAGFIHDVVVLERTRRLGIASALVEAAADWLRGRGVPRVMLWTADKNRGAQDLFARLGFRRTMIEMTREL